MINDYWVDRVFGIDKVRGQCSLTRWELDFGYEMHIGHYMDTGRYMIIG